MPSSAPVGCTSRHTNTIHHHGGAQGVTGSCHELVLGPDASLLIDCGLFQGEDAAPRGGADQLAIEFDVSRVVALVVTHVHIDHVGMCPSFFLGARRLTGSRAAEKMHLIH